MFHTIHTGYNIELPTPAGDNCPDQGRIPGKLLCGLMPLQVQDTHNTAAFLEPNNTSNEKPFLRRP
jgi:hypothetical protein